jgi:hypothetical protein
MRFGENRFSERLMRVMDLLALLMTADRLVEKDGADANADIDTGAFAPAASTDNTRRP